VPRSALPPRADVEAAAPKVVAVVDDDPAVREIITSLLPSVGLRVEAFASTQEFLAKMDPASTNCLVLDVRLPGKNGLDFQDELRRAHVPVPVVFITGYGDIPMTVRAMKGGAVEFLPKPFGGQELLDAVHRAIEQDSRRRDRQQRTMEARARMATLTPRERQIMAQVVRGLRNKVIANALGISEVTVKAHRRQVMVKMGAASLADLVWMSAWMNDGDR
jgi:FixJ family two-component response regulator